MSNEELMAKANELAKAGDREGIERLADMAEGFVKTHLQLIAMFGISVPSAPRERESYDFIPCITDTRRSWRDER